MRVAMCCCLLTVACSSGEHALRLQPFSVPSAHSGVTVPARTFAIPGTDPSARERCARTGRLPRDLDVSWALVEVDPAWIHVSGAPLVPLDDGVVADDAARGQLVSDLYDELLALAEAAKERQGCTASGLPDFGGDIALRIHPEIRFDTLRKVLFTAGQAQFGNMAFVVEDAPAPANGALLGLDTELSVLPTTLPAIGAPPSGSALGGLLGAKPQRRDVGTGAPGRAVGFVDPAVDPHSTFAADVDTASFTLTRRLLQRGRPVPWRSVRAEEFVNAQRYDYAAPRRDTFAVHTDAMPDPLRPGQVVLRVGVQARRIGAAERGPLHATLLVDVSGSMGALDKLDLAVDALHHLVDQLGPRDTVGICTYAGRVARVLEPTGDTERIHRALDTLQSGGSTAMSSGIDQAYDMAAAAFEPGAENRVLILSDGDANVGATTWDELLSSVRGHADRGITLTTVGFGSVGYRDQLMERLADNGDGSSFFVADRAEARRLFSREGLAALHTVARDVKLQVAFRPDRVAAYRLIGYDNRALPDELFREDRADAGEVGAGHAVTALYALRLRDGPLHELATVRVRHEDPGPDGDGREQSWTVRDDVLGPGQPATHIAYSAATLAEVLRGSPHAEGLRLEAVAEVAERAVRPGHRLEDRALVAMIRGAAAR